MTNEKRLAELLGNGMITLDDVPRFNEDMKILDRHNREIYQGKDGRWRTYLDDPSKKDGRRRISSSDRLELEKEIIKYYKELDAKKEEDEKENNATFEEFYYKWQNERKYVAVRTKNKYHSDYKRFYKNHPIIKKKVVDIKFADVRNFLCENVTNYKLDSVQANNMAINIRGVLRYAVEEELIEKSPAEGYKIPHHLLHSKPIPKAEDEVFSPQEQEAYLKCVKTRQNRWNLAYLGVALNFQLGLRIGELSSLKWTDIDGKHITIQRQESSHKEVDYYLNELGKIIEIHDDPKTPAGVREIFLTKEAIKILAEIKEISFEYGIYDKDGYIFKSRDVKRLTCEQMLRPLDNISRKLKTKYKGNHKIRKTVLSRLFDDGVNPEEVRRIAGYKKTSTTVNSYWFNRFSREETDKSFEKALSI